MQRLDGDNQERENKQINIREKTGCRYKVNNYTQQRTEPALSQMAHSGGNANR
jgi:hypothetical protein